MESRKLKRGSLVCGGGTRSPIQMVRRDGTGNGWNQRDDLNSPAPRVVAVTLPRGSCNLRDLALVQQVTGTGPRRQWEKVVQLRRSPVPPGKVDSKEKIVGLEKRDYGLPEYEEDPYAFPRIFHAVDDVVISQNFGLEDPRPQKFHEDSTVLYSQNILEISECINKYALTAESPFPNSHVIIIDSDPDPVARERLYMKLGRLVTLAGQFVHSLTLGLRLDRPTADWYTDMWKLLCKMPSLRTLQMRILDVNDFNHLAWAGLFKLVEIEKKFPKLPHLRVLECENVPTVVTGAVVEANKSLEYIQIRRTFVPYDWNLFENVFLEIPMPKLEELSISFGDIAELRQLGRLRWPLKKLTIRLDVPRPQQVELDCEVFETLHRFAKTLETLRITFNYRPDPLKKLKLPKVKNLDVFFMAEANLNFVTTLTALQQMHVHFTSSNFDDQNVINFHGNWSSMDDSNVWLVLPSLSLLRVSVPFGGRLQTFTFANHRNPLPDDTVY